MHHRLTFFWTSAPRVTLFALVLVACNTSSPPKDAPRDLADAGPSHALPATASAPVMAPAPSGCSVDDDCRTWSSYCQEAPCGCRVLAKTAPDPRCAGPGNVACFADPCMNKAAACQDGRCVLVLQPK